MSTSRPLMELLSRCLIFKSCHCISFEARWFWLRVTDLQLSYRDLTTWQGTRTVVPVMATSVTCPVIPELPKKWADFFFFFFFFQKNIQVYIIRTQLAFGWSLKRLLFLWILVAVNNTLKNLKHSKTSHIQNCSCRKPTAIYGTTNLMARPRSDWHWLFPSLLDTPSLRAPTIMSSMFLKWRCRKALDRVRLQGSPCAMRAWLRFVSATNMTKVGFL